MKKLIILFLILLLTVCLVACMPSDDPPDDSSDTGDPIEYTEDLSYASLGDGTCCLSTLGPAASNSIIVVPPIAPTGDKIIGVLSNVFNRECKAEKVVFSEGLQYISSNAFYHCKSIKELVLPDSLEKIHDSAFVATEIESISLGNGAMEIGRLAFAGLTNLEEIVLSPNTISIGEKAFS